MNHQCLVIAAKLGGILSAQPVAHLFCLISRIHHDEEDRLFAEWRKLIAICTPPFYSCCQIGLIAYTGHVTLGLVKVGNALGRSLHYIVYNRLFDGIVRDDPGEKTAFGETWRGGKVELGSNR